MKINALTFRGGGDTSNNATFRLCDLKSNLIFLLRRIKNKTLCHAELVSASHDVETLKRVQGDKVFNTPSYHSAEQNNPVNCFVRGFCGILKNIFKKIPQCVSLMRDDIKIRHTFKKSLAFTLAETLIVMGIIGVVAALTIPNLNSSTADKEKVAKLNKIYSNLEDAMGRAQAVYGPFEEWFQTDTTITAQATRFGERVTEFMKPTKNCKTDANSACWKNAPNTLYGIDPNTANCYKFINPDGSSVSLCKEAGATVVTIHYMAFIDVDGPTKGSNGIGDQFLINIADSGELTPHNIQRDYSYLTSCTSGTGRDYCTSWTLRFGNMDYLKSNCKKTLDGTTNTSCK